MNNPERIAGLNEGEYQQLFGVKKNIFEKMLTILQEKFHAEHLRGGHPPKLCLLDKLIITLGYYREYRTLQHIAFDYAVAKSTVCESIRWVEKTLIRAPCEIESINFNNFYKIAVKLFVLYLIFY